MRFQCMRKACRGCSGHGSSGWWSVALIRLLSTWPGDRVACLCKLGPRLGWYTNLAFWFKLLGNWKSIRNHRFHWLADMFALQTCVPKYCTESFRQLVQFWSSCFCSKRKHLLFMVFVCKNVLGDQPIVQMQGALSFTIIPCWLCGVLLRFVNTFVRTFAKERVPFWISRSLRKLRILRR